MDSSDLHIFFLPLLTPGHMLPMVDMAKLFAQRGVRATLVTTPGNAARIRDSLQGGNTGHGIQLLQVEFPSAVAGLPNGSDTLAACRTPDVTEDFFRALAMLRQPFERLLKEHHPDCVISDSFYPWTDDAASEFGIPRLVFHGTGGFSIDATGMAFRFMPHSFVTDDAEEFVLLGIPHRIRLTRSQLPDFILSPPDYMKEMGASHVQSYGVVVNSFRELEPGYAANVAGLKTWHIGPLSLCNRDAADQAVRGQKASGDNIEGCLRWLDSQAPGSVLYVCFGSLGRFTRAQLREIALGLEASGHPFLWVLRDVDGSGAELLPEGFQERTRGRGLVLWGWAPQLLILDHGAVGGFMTHCGWNSTLEAIAAGKPMVAWPLFAEQFFNEKFVVQVLGVGVAVGAAVCSTKEEERALVEKARVEEAVVRVMGGAEEAEAMRRRVRALAVMAKEAAQEGGSSHCSLGDLIHELIGLKKSRSEEP